MEPSPVADLTLTSTDPAVIPAASDATTVYASPGVPTNRKIATGFFLALVGGFTLLVARAQGASVVVSTIIGLLFIGGFIAYLRVVAPAPFSITLSAEGVQHEEQGMEQTVIPWADVVKVKEEQFPNKLPISLAIYKRVGAKGLHRSFIIYRDDLPQFDDLLTDLKARVPSSTRWNTEITHE